MKLVKFALTPPIAAISVAIFAALGAWGNPISWVGGHGTSWEEPANWDPAGVPGEGDEVTIGTKNAQVVAENGFTVSSLTVSNGAQLTIGNKASLPTWTVSIAGDLNLDTSAKLYAYAPPLPDLSVFADRAAAIAALFENAAIVSVGGTFTIAGGATAYPVCDRLSGNPVFFKVKDFNLAADGAIDVKKAGWGLFKTPAEGRPAGSLNANLSYSYGFGTGNSYTLGGGYGGFGGGWNALNGNPYGSPYAPFLSGSPSGLNNLNNVNNVTGPGAAVVFASGVATVAGTVNANGTQPECGGSSGGSIWIAAKTLSVSPSATLTATTTKLTSTYKGGGGGRISLAENVTDAEIAALAATTGLPEGFASHPLVECVTDVTGAGVCVSNVLDGTATFVTYCGKGLVLDNFTDTPVVAEGLPFYGVRLIEGEEYSVTAPEYAGGAEDPEFVRIACAGYVLSNATAEVRAPASRTLAFTPDAAEGPYSVTWKWSGREYRVRALASGDGTVSVPDAWYAEGTEVTLNATPAAGKRFVCWLGDVPGGKSTAAQISFTPEAGCRITAVFANEDGATQAKAWTGGAGTASWDDAGNWSPAGVPTADDAVTIASGTVTAPYGIVAGSLTLGSGAALSLASTGTSVTAAPQDESEAAATCFLYVAGNLSNAGQLKLGGIGDAVRRFVLEVGGDVVLSGTSKTAVYAARGVGDVATPAQLYAKRTDFKIGGGLILSDTAILYPVCDPLTGTAVFLDAGSASVASGASVNADGLGYDWVTCVDGIRDARAKFTLNFSVNGASSKPELRQTFGAGAGNTYAVGAGHGSKSVGSNATYGKAYGSRFAPLMPGSPSGQLNSNPTAVGGGVIWLRVAEALSVAGTLTASGGGSNSGASGGGVWLVAKEFVFADDAVVRANAGSSSYDQGVASGGRISLGSRLSDVAMAELVTLENLNDSFIEGEVAECQPEVLGSVRTAVKGNDGTVTRVSYVAGATTLTLEADQPVAADGLVWATTAVGDGDEVSVTAPAYGYLASSPESVRYACAGYDLYNGQGLVRSVSDRSCAFTVVSSEGPYRLQYRWESPERRVCLSVPSSGGSKVQANGATMQGGDVWVASTQTLSLEAVPAADEEFVTWIGDIPGGRQDATTLSGLDPSVGSMVMAVFRRKDGQRTAKVWTGDAGTSLWSDAANWSPAGVPTADDDVTLSAATVIAPEGVVAGSLSIGADAALYVGSTAGEKLKAVAQGLSPITTRFLYVVGDVENAGKLALGGIGDAVSRFVWAVDGDFRMSGGSETAVFAARGVGDVNTPALLYAQRTDFKVGGAIVLSDAAVLSPVCDPLTGTAVFFDAANVSVAATASVSAKGLGYDWMPCAEQGVDPRATFTLNRAYPIGNPVLHETFAPGAGSTYMIGAGHGGKSLKANATYGNTYGSKYAPLMPGSPSGQLNQGSTGVGGGVIWIRAAQTLSVDGTLDATATAPSSGGAASGGSIWLMAKNFAFGSSASVLANAGTCNYGDGVAGGGRVSLASGMTDEALAELVTLDELTEDYLEATVVECTPNVNGTKTGSSSGYAGTVTRVSYVAGATFLTMATDTAVDAAGLVWTTTPVGDGEAVSVTAPQYGYLSANPQAVRYACAGYELYDAAGLVRAETTRTCAFTAVGSEGPYRLVFKWANPEHRFRADKSSGGASTISVNGVVSDLIDLWLDGGTEVTLGAVAADGFDFVGWIGDVPGGRQAAAAVGPFVPAIGAEVTAYFRRADGVLSEKTWTGAAMARWDDAANWSPAGVPTLDDDVTVDGTAFAPRGIVAGALTVGASGKVFLATKDDSASNASQDVTDAAPTRFLLVGGDLASAGQMILGGNGDAVAQFVYSVGGDLMLSDSSVTAVFPARTTGEVSSNALAAARTDFAVGGKMTLADTAVLYPNCDPLTGTAVRFGVGSLNIGAQAKINATGLGYGWQRCPDGTEETKDPRALFTVTIVTPETNLPEIYQSFGPGTGYIYEDGAGHGGAGGYWNSSRHSAYGKAYDRLEAPVMPGSPNGVYNRLMSNTGRGGGVIWFAVTDRAEIAGVLEAKGAYAANFGGASGGSIFLTAYEFGWSGTAALSVKGVSTGYNAQGAGGRIALGEGLQEPRLSQLEATGVSNLRAKHHIDVTTYTNRVPVSVDISSGGGPRAEAGSFVYLERPNIGLMLLVR